MYHDTTPETLRNWAKNGKLKPASPPDEKKYYLRGEVIAIPRKGKRHK